MTNSSYTIGVSAWDRNDLISHLKEFLNLYDSRPVSDNSGGQKAAQLFYSWYVAKKLQPEFIIESGVYKGQGTWAFENASPKSRIICLDPFLKNYTGYRSNTALYFEKDFKDIAWSELISIENRKSALCFFDDHQNALDRIIMMKHLGFKVAMFEDNYPEGQGDCISLKKLLEFPEKYSILPGFTAQDYLEKILQTYEEMPPIFALEKTRWGTLWASHRTSSPLLSDSSDYLMNTFRNEMDQYTWINYVELK